MIERQRLRQMHKSIHLFDNVLGLATEQFFYASMKKELLRVVRTKKISTLLVCSAGTNLTEKLAYRINIVLASCIRNLLRHSDSATFLKDKGYFLMLLPLTDVEQSKIVQNKIQDAVNSLEIERAKGKKWKLFLKRLR